MEWPSHTMVPGLTYQGSYTALYPFTKSRMDAIGCTLPTLFIYAVCSRGKILSVDVTPDHNL